MLAKRKSAKKAAIAAVAALEKKHQSLTTARAVEGGSVSSVISGAKAQAHKKMKAKGVESSRAGRASEGRLSSAGAHKVLTHEDVEEAGADRGGMIRTIGDHINTRLREIGGDEDLDADLFDETKHHLMEEARLAAGTKQRVVSTAVRHFLRASGLDNTTAVRASSSADPNEAVEEAGSLRLVRVRHNSNSVTAVAVLGTGIVVFGDKSGKVYLTDLSVDTNAGGMATSARQERLRRAKVMLEPALPAATLCIAISDTRANRPTTRDLFERTTVDMSCTSYVAAGAADGSIGIWETATRQYKGLLFMHRKPVTGLSFRALTSTLYSVSEDGTMRVWSVPQMMAQDKLFGHEGKISAVHGLRKETCATVGDDGTMRFWKVDAATQQSYEYLSQYREEALRRAAGLVREESTAAATKKDQCRVPMECVAMVNETVIVAGADDGSLVVFDVNRRKPLVVVPHAHGCGFIGDGTGLEKAAAQADRDGSSSSPQRHCGQRSGNPITAVAAIPYADVIASASYDGVVRVWQLSGISTAQAPGKRTLTSADVAAQSGRLVPELHLIATLPIPALVSGLTFSPDGDVLSVACSKEPRSGRWVVQRSALNSVCVVPLTSAGLKPLGEMLGGIEHVPAQLYGFQEHDQVEEEGEGTMASAGVAGHATVDLIGSEEEGVDGGESNDDDDDSNSGNKAAATSLLDVGVNGQVRFNAGVLAAVGGNNSDGDADADESASRSRKRAAQRSGGAKVKRMAKKAAPVVMKKKKAVSAKKLKMKK